MSGTRAEQGGRRETDGGRELRAVAAALARPGQPAPLFEALEQATQATLGHRLFTILRYHPDLRETERLHTSDPRAYPVGGRKAMRATPSTEQVYGRREPYLGRTAADIRACFADHEQILALGCESVLNVPVLFDGDILGAVNLLHQAGWYDQSHLPLAQAFAALAVPGFLALPAAGRPGARDGRSPAPERTPAGPR